MALNLNKGNEGNSGPTSGKKGLNLSKSEDSAKVDLNLSKDKIVKDDSTILHSEQNEERKKSPILYILIAVVVLGIGGYWLMNKNTNSQEVSVAPIDNAAADTAIAKQDEQTQSQVDANNNPVTNEQPVSATNPNEVQKTSKSNSNNAKAVSPNSETKSQNSPNAGASSESVSQLQGSIEQKARQVINGEFGNGSDRKVALGDEYASIQAKVNEIYRKGN